MIPFWEKNYDWRSAAITDAYDELPLWSAMPGQLLLENLPFAGQESVLDIGSGTGFPLLLLARRFGPRTRVYGVDNWAAAQVRAAQKIAAWGLENVTLLASDAQSIDLPSASIDLITSNLGLNNFEAVGAVLDECKRLLRTDGRLCLSTNLRGTFAAYYAAMKSVVSGDVKALIAAHENHRPTLQDLQTMLAAHGFETVRVVADSYTMTYADGTAFLNDYFIGMGFLPSWVGLVPVQERAVVFPAVEQQLNARAAEAGKLVMEVPIAYLELRVVG